MNLTPRQQAKNNRLLKSAIKMTNEHSRLQSNFDEASRPWSEIRKYWNGLAIKWGALIKSHRENVATFDPSDKDYHFAISGLQTMEARYKKFIDELAAKDVEYNSDPS